MTACVHPWATLRPSQVASMGAVSVRGGGLVSMPSHEHKLPKRAAEDAIIDADRNSEIEQTLRLYLRKDIAIQVVLSERQF